MSSLAFRPDPSRVFGIAVAVSIHIAAGMLLLIGISPMWNLPQAIDVPMETVWIPPKPTPPVPVMPVAPAKPQVVKPMIAPMQRIPLPEVSQPEPITLASVTEPVEISTPVPSELPSETPAVPSSSTLAYAFAPPPAYPIQALRRGESGTVWLRVEVNAEGRPTEVSVHQSSGSKALDLAARKQVLQRWRFVPARQGDQAIAAVGLVPIVFTPAD